MISSKNNRTAYEIVKRRRDSNELNSILTFHIHRPFYSSLRLFSSSIYDVLCLLKDEAYESNLRSSIIHFLILLNLLFFTFITAEMVSEIAVSNFFICLDIGVHIARIEAFNEIFFNPAGYFFVYQSSGNFLNLCLNI